MHRITQVEHPVALDDELGILEHQVAVARSQQIADSVAPVAGQSVRRVRASCLTSTGISGTPVGLRPSKPNPRRVSPTSLAA